MKIENGITFDDVLLKPAFSDVLPKEVVLRSRITSELEVGLPVVSAAMDTVTEHKVAIALARQGALGCIHKNLSPSAQAWQVRLVKKSESYIVNDPLIIKQNESIESLVSLMAENKISGVPVVDDDKKLVGIITRRDILFVENGCHNIKDIKVKDVMTKDNLVTIGVDVGKDRARELLYNNKIERLIVVDKENHCVGLVTLRDIHQSIDYPNASKDLSGKLLVVAAVGVSREDMERADLLIKAGVDVINIDTAHGHSAKVLNFVRELNHSYPHVQCIAGNIATAEGAKSLIDAGVKGIKVGIGPGSICTTRIVAGVGVPQLTAINDVYSVAKEHAVPIIADGGIKYSGDVVKALAAGASMVMLGGMFAGTKETPGEIIFYQGRSYKNYRGMGSIGAMARGSADRYFQEDIKDSLKLVAEGVEGRVPFKGDIVDVLNQILGGVRAGMGYVGCKTIKEMPDKCTFIRITTAALSESHPHNVSIVDSPPNYAVTS